MPIEFILLLLFSVGLGAVWLLRRMLGGLTEPSVLALIAAPFLVYGIVGGAIAEFSGFGVSAKFNKTAKEPVKELALAVEKLAIKYRISDTDFEKSAFFQKCTNYFIIRDDLGKRSTDPGFKQFAYKVASAIKGAMLCGDFYGIVVVDRSDHFLGLFQRDRFASLISYPLDRYCIFDYQRCHDSPDISAILGETELGVILKDPDVRVNTSEATKHVVQESDSLVSIVKNPEFSQASVFAVLDRHGKFVGLLPKQAIYDKIFSVILETQ